MDRLHRAATLDHSTCFVSRVVLWAVGVSAGALAFTFLGYPLIVRLRAAARDGGSRHP
jgi:hypothetical protein